MMEYELKMQQIRDQNEEKLLLAKEREKLHERDLLLRKKEVSFNDFLNLKTINNFFAKSDEEKIKKELEKRKKEEQEAEENKRRAEELNKKVQIF